MSGSLVNSLGDAERAALQDVGDLIEELAMLAALDLEATQGRRGPALTN